MDEPNKRNEKGSDKEHDGFFFDDSIRVLVEVLEIKGFNCQGHKGGCEEHTECVFHSKWVSLWVGVCMFFHMNKDMKNFTHDELVEKDNTE